MIKLQYVLVIYWLIVYLYKAYYFNYKKHIFLLRVKKLKRKKVFETTNKNIIIEPKSVLI